tara:strand:- start:8739 stop:9203 length:465 start_codon:yes stop_codon:yes gene_type:complete
MQKYRINIKTGQEVNDNGQLGVSFYSQDWREATTVEVKDIELGKLKKAKILETKIKREEKISNFVVDEGVIETNNRAETVLILEGYKKILDQNITLAEYGLKDEKLIKLTKTIIDKWLLAISKQYNQAWLDYRAVEKKINNAKTLTTLNKIIIK